MPALEGFGKASRAAGRGLKATASGTARTSRWLRRNVGIARNIGGVGNKGMMRLLDMHAFSCAGDTLITIGLAGTIFFNVPAGEARSRVALYLLVTMVPFALLAPIVGPVLDRFRHGRRFALAATFLGRAILAWVIADNLTGLALYPAAFGVLALSRAYGVARSAAVPRLLPRGLGLSQAGARASVWGTVAGAVIAPVGLITASLFSAAWPLKIAVIPLLAGVVVSFLLPPKADSDAPEVPPKVFHLPWRQREENGQRVLSGSLLVNVLISSAALRALYGFLLLFLAFAIRANDIPRELGGFNWSSATVALGAVGVALGLGTFLATAIGTGLRLRRPARVQLFCLSAVALAGLAMAVRFTFFTILGFCLVTAICSGLAKLAVDATIQDRVPDTVRASAFAHSETLLMLSWVAGGAIGLIPDDGRVGLTLAVVLIAAAAVRAYLVSRRLRDEILGRPPRNLPDVRRPPSTDAAPVLSGTVSNVSTTEVDDDPPPGFHVYQPTAPDAGVTDPRTGG
jgi:MFS family permease